VLHPRPRWGAYSTPPNSLAAFNGPTSKGREGKEKREERKGARGGEKRGQPQF